MKSRTLSDGHYPHVSALGADKLRDLARVLIFCPDTHSVRGGLSATSALAHHRNLVRRPPATWLAEQEATVRYWDRRRAPFARAGAGIVAQTIRGINEVLLRAEQRAGGEMPGWARRDDFPRHAVLCAAHARLDPWVLGQLYGMLVHECEAGTERVRRRGERALRERHRRGKTRWGSKDDERGMGGALYRVEEHLSVVNAMTTLWREREDAVAVISEVVGMDGFGTMVRSGAGCVFAKVESGCEACVLAVVGGTAAALGELRAAVVARKRDEEEANEEEEEKAVAVAMEEQEKQKRRTRSEREKQRARLLLIVVDAWIDEMGHDRESMLRDSLWTEKAIGKVLAWTRRRQGWPRREERRSARTRTKTAKRMRSRRTVSDESHARSRSGHASAVSLMDVDDFLSDEAVRAMLAGDVTDDEGTSGPVEADGTEVGGVAAEEALAVYELEAPMPAEDGGCGGAEERLEDAHGDEDNGQGRVMGLDLDNEADTGVLTAGVSSGKGQGMADTTTMTTATETATETETGTDAETSTRDRSSYASAVPASLRPAPLVAGVDAASVAGQQTSGRTSAWTNESVYSTNSTVAGCGEYGRDEDKNEDSSSDADADWIRDRDTMTNTFNNSARVPGQGGVFGPPRRYTRLSCVGVPLPSVPENCVMSMPNGSVGSELPAEDGDGNDGGDNHNNSEDKTNNNNPDTSSPGADDDWCVVSSPPPPLRDTRRRDGTAALQRASSAVLGLVQGMRARARYFAAPRLGESGERSQRPGGAGGDTAEVTPDPSEDTMCADRRPHAGGR